MNRPMGVTILGWIAIVFGAIGLIASMFLVITAIGVMAIGAGVAGTGGLVGGTYLAGAAMILLALTVWIAVLCVIEIVFGIGALQLKPWAWTLGTIWVWVSIVTNIISAIANRSSFVNSLIGIIVAIAILYYLYTDEVRAAFGKSDKAAPAFITPLFLWMNGVLASGSGAAAQPPQAPGGYPQPGAPTAYQPPPSTPPAPPAVSATPEPPAPQPPSGEPPVPPAPPA